MQPNFLKGITFIATPVAYTSSLSYLKELLAYILCSVCVHNQIKILLHNLDI